MEFSDSLHEGEPFAPQDLGTFKDCLKAPIHRWFKYPAGFSYKLVEAKLREHKLDERSWVLDPFTGSGTTNVVAKAEGVNSIGIEAHPFVYWVAKVKTFWEYDWDELRSTMNRLLSRILSATPSEWEAMDCEGFPDLVKKCFSPENLKKLAFIRDAIAELDCSAQVKDFFNLALTDTLRTVSKAGVGWPYIAPTKFHERTKERDALEEFASQVRLMFDDLKWQISHCRSRKVECRLLLWDARKPFPNVSPESVDLAITSPPYLNNYDYADRTRLEMYFFGWAKTWRDITEKVRSKLMVAATTQVRRSDFGAQPLSDEVRQASPKVYAELLDKIEALRQIRLHKGGRKNYDLMVAGYFNDMVKVLKNVLAVLKTGAEFILVLGDSAPYGVYIPTEEYLGELALGIGFSQYHIQVLRRRGGKWENNPQRHKVKLKESILTLKK